MRDIRHVKYRCAHLGPLDPHCPRRPLRTAIPCPSWPPALRPLPPPRPFHRRRATPLNSIHRTSPFSLTHTTSSPLSAGRATTAAAAPPPPARAPPAPASSSCCTSCGCATPYGGTTPAGPAVLPPTRGSAEWQCSLPGPTCIRRMAAGLPTCNGGRRGDQLYMTAWRQDGLTPPEGGQVEVGRGEGISTGILFRM